MRLLLISSSYVFGRGYLDHSEPEIRRFLAGKRTIAFVPFAAHDHDAYTTTVRERFGRMGFDAVPIEQLESADAIFVGGGNTFRLLKKLYDRNLLGPIGKRVRAGLPYIGSSAGSVVAAPTIRTTNDMPIVQPPSLQSLGLISFQLNCHFLDPDPNSRHMGETREARIREFHEENAAPVVGLREGSMLWIEDGSITLRGDKQARIFRRGEEPVEVAPGSRLEPYLT